MENAENTKYTQDVWVVEGVDDLEGTIFAYCSSKETAEKAKSIVESNGFEDMVKITYSELPMDMIFSGGKMIYLKEKEEMSQTTKAISGKEYKCNQTSDEVYEHILCCICPVSLSKPGLSIKPEEKKIEDRIRDWVIEKPLNAMLYPAFNDRSEDIHSLLYFSKNVKCMQEEFVHAMTGIQDEIRSGEDEKLLFGEKFTDCTNGSADYDILYAFQEKALEVLESADTDEVKISPKDLGSMLQSSGVEEEQAEAFVKSMGDVKELNLGNLVDKSKMTVTLPDATIKIPAQYAYRLEVKEIDGRMYAAFPIDENYVEVNGIAVKAR